MTKNALQAQLLKAGLVDSKKAKKLTKQAEHAKRTGNSQSDEVKAALAKAQAEKLAKDQQLNREKQAALEAKTLRANVVQMIKQHQLSDTQGEVTYQFVDSKDNKIKKLNVSQKLFDQIVAGHVVIARLGDPELTGVESGYALLPRPLADRIEQKLTGFMVVINDKSENTDETMAEDDPYADYAIPDDLMW